MCTAHGERKEMYTAFCKGKVKERTTWKTQA